jgi:hypothetical protein
MGVRGGKTGKCETLPNTVLPLGVSSVRHGLRTPPSAGARRGKEIFMKVRNAKLGERVDDCVDWHLRRCTEVERARIKRMSLDARASHRDGPIDIAKVAVEIENDREKMRRGETFGTCVVCGALLHRPSICIIPVCFPYEDNTRPRPCKWIASDIANGC